MPVATLSPSTPLSDIRHRRTTITDFDSDINAEDTLTDADAQSQLAVYKQKLLQQGTPTSPSSSLPHREIRSFIQNAVSSCSLPTILQVSTFYLDLLSKVSISFDDATLQSCLLHLTRSLSNASASRTTCPQRCNARTTLCNNGVHTTLSEYVAFWKHADTLLRRQSLDVSNVELIQHFIRAFVHVLHHAPAPQLLAVSVNALTFLCNQGRHGNVTEIISCAYKALFPVVMANLPTHNRNAVIDVLQSAANTETSCHSSTHNNYDGDETMSPASSPLHTTYRSPSNCPSPSSNFSGEDVDTNNRNEGENSSPNARTPISRTPLLLVPFFKLCVEHVIDKADDRVSLSTIIHGVIVTLPTPTRQSIFPLLTRSATSTKVPVRLLIVDLLARLLCDSDLSLPPAIARHLLLALSARCKDRVASIRSKAIATLTNVLSAARSRLSSLLARREFLRLLASISERLRDAKSTVRKAAVDFVGFACTLGTDEFDTDADSPDEHPSTAFCPLDLTSMLSERCGDVVATVRLTATMQLRKITLHLAHRPNFEEHRDTFEAFTEALLPLLGDTDARCKEAALFAVGTFVFGLTGDDEDCDAMSDENGEHMIQKMQSLIFSMLGEGTLSSPSRMRHAIFTLVKDGRVTEAALRTIVNVATTASRDSCTNSEPSTTTTSDGAWIVLGVAASAGKAASISRFIGKDVLHVQVTERRNVSALKVAACVSAHMNDEERTELRQILLETVFKRLDSDWTDGQAISASMEALVSLDGDACGDALLKRCDTLIADGNAMEDSAVVHALHVIGAICEHAVLVEMPYEGTLTFVQAMTSNNRVDARLRALALSTIGQLCLCDSGRSESVLDTSRNAASDGGVMGGGKIGEALTRRFVHLLVHELDNATSSATRSNAVVVLCDLCRQYTSIIEPFLPRVAGLLYDTSRFVRQQTQASLVCLLQEDYIKVRPGLLLFQIARGVLDDCSEVRRTAEYALQKVVHEKNASILLVSFVELILVLNECERSQTFTRFRRPFERGVRVVGSQHAEKRFRVYDAVLCALAEVQRWRLPARLRADILGEIVEERLDVETPQVQGVLQDCLALLSSDRVMVTGRVFGVASATADSSGSVEDKQGDESGGGGAQRAALRNVQLMELQELTIPLLLQLRQHLQSKRSPLLGDLMKCMCTLLRPHCEQLHLYVTDAAIRSEIEHVLNASSAADTDGDVDEDGAEADGAEDDDNGGDGTQAQTQSQMQE